MKRTHAYSRAAIFGILLLFSFSFTALKAQDFTILPLGNSITASFANQPGYRFYLWEDLTGAGYEIDFVGTKSGNGYWGSNYPGWPAGFDSDHEGHPGYETYEIVNSLVDWLPGYHADIALIHLGTNDMLNSPTTSYADRTVNQLKGVVKVLRMTNPNIAIFIAQIIPIVNEDFNSVPPGDPAFVDYNAGIVYLNSQIPVIASELSTTNSPVIIVDCYSPMDTSTDFQDDGVHILPSGEDKMAQAFYDAIITNLPTIPHRWTGAVSSDWNTPGNWNTNTVPGGSSHVVIQESATTWPSFTGDFVVGSDCKSFSMETNAQFTVSGNFIYQQGETVRLRGTAVLNLGGDLKNSESIFGGGKIDKLSGAVFEDSDAYMTLEVTTPFQLASVKVYPNNSTLPGSRTFFWSAYDSGANDWIIQEQVTVSIPEDPELDGERVVLNFNITATPDPMNYPHRIGITGSVPDDAKLARDYQSSGFYPINIGSVAVLQPGTGSVPSWFYWYMYDWEYIVDDPSAIPSDVAYENSTINFSGGNDNSIVGTPIYTGAGKIDFTTGLNWGNSMFFQPDMDVINPFKLISVKIEAKSAGQKTFFWESSDGTIGEEKVVDIAAGLQRVNLNFIIPPGNNHRIGVRPGGPDLRLDIQTSDLNYPYTLENVAFINAVGFVLRYYFYLYDMEISPIYNDINIDKYGHELATDGNVGINQDLVVNEGSYLTLSTDDMLTVRGDLKLLSDGSGISSFLNYGSLDVRGNTRVEQYLTPDAWHYVSSPISDGLSGVYTGAYLKWFDEVTYGWNYITSTTTPLNPMQGYSVWHYTNPLTALFEGTLNEGTQFIQVTADNPNGINVGYNLVGNPYPSAIDWDAVSGWDKTNVDNTIYFWEGEGGPDGSGNYHYYQGTGGELPSVGIGNGTRYIPPGQGFFIKATSTGSFEVNNNARLHNGQSFYKSTNETEVPQIRIKTFGMEDKSDEMVVRFHEEATPEHDNQFDAFKLNGYLYPQIYSRTVIGSHLAINTLPEYYDGMLIHLGFTCPEDGIYYITLTEFINFEENLTLFLEDKLTGEFHPISDAPVYEFSASTEDTPDRFLLRFAGELTELEEVDNYLGNIYSYDHNIVVILSDNQTDASVDVFDLMGRKIYSGNISGDTKTVIPVAGQDGHYIVKVRTDINLYTKKVLIR